MKPVLCFLLVLSLPSFAFPQSEDFVQPVNTNAVGFAKAGDLAVNASLELKNARASYALREGIWALGIRAFLPQLNLQVSEDERLSLISADYFTKTYTLGLEQLLFDGGRTSVMRNLEHTELAILFDQLNRDEAAVSESALSAYRQILTSRMIVQIREQTLVALNEQHRIMTEELALGLIIPLDLAQGDIALKEAELELEKVHIQLRDQEEQFAVLLGLQKTPELSEEVDIYRSPFIPDAYVVYSLAAERNPDLVRLRYSIKQREAEAKLSARSWIPTLKATGTYSLSGQKYPLTKQSWSLGLTMQFSSPWLNVSMGGNAGWEYPYDRTARVQTAAGPLPDPASGLSAKQSHLALNAERENYQRVMDRLKRESANQVTALEISEQHRQMAVETMNLGAEKYRLYELMLELGRITRLELMEQRLEYAEKQTAAALAAASVLEAERTLERFIDLPPGTLEAWGKNEK